MNINKLKTITNLSEEEKFDLLEDACRNMKKLDVEKLLPLLEDKNKGIKQEAIKLIIRFADEKTVKNVLSYIRSSNPDTRNSVVEILYKIVDKNLEAVANLIKDNNKDLRIFGCQILPHSRDSKSVFYLKEALKDKNANVRNAAVMALAGTSQKLDISFLFGYWKKEKEDWVKFSILEAINKKGSKKYLKNIFSLIEGEPDFIKANILKLFKKFGDIKLIEKLIDKKEYFSDSLYSNLNNTIINLINNEKGLSNNFYSKKIIGYLKEIIKKDKNHWNRYQSINILSGYKDKEILEFLKECVFDKHPLVRIASIKALSRYKDKSLDSLIEKFLGDEDQEVRKVAKNFYFNNEGRIER